MDKYAVIGHPVKHSLSPFVHAAFAKQTKQQLSYVAIEAPLDGFAQTITEFRRNGGKGANVTLPFKIEAFQLANESSDLAKLAGAANTLVFKTDGSIFADNTDGPGVVQDLTHNHHYSLRQKRILILGAGGACRTILGSLLAAAPAKLVLANRTKQKAVDIATEYQMRGQIEGIGLDELIEEPFDLIINSTSAGLTGAFMDLPGGLIGAHTWCYDLLYGDKKSSFLTWAENNHAAMRLDGLGMLVEQAAASFYIWRGIYPDTATVIEQLRHPVTPT